MTEVLIVDDDPDVRTMLSFTLRGYGFDVREASDGDQALHELEARSPDAMVLDLMMPVDGFTVLGEMRDRGLAADTRVIVLTCKGEERDLVRGWQLGADDYLTKPVDPDLLAAKITQAIAAGAPARASR